MFKKSWLFLLFLLVLIPLQANADITLKFNGFIADEANLLSEQVENDLNMTLWDLQKKSGADLVVVTLPSLNGRTVEEVALDIGRSYKLGAVGKNNGMVYLTALNERKMRIEQGLGLEDKIPVSTLESIMNTDILPYYNAQAEGVKIKKQGVCPPALSPSSSDSGNSGGDIPWWGWPIVLLGALCSPRRRRFSSGSFGGFGGGGGFGGSGCSGSW